MSSKNLMEIASVAFEKNGQIQSNNGEGIEESKRNTCKEMKCELVGFDSLPEYLKDNEFILGYYRCEWPLKQTVLSVLSIHNETVNVWT